MLRTYLRGQPGTDRVRTDDWNTKLAYDVVKLRRACHRSLGLAIVRCMYRLRTSAGTILLWMDSNVSSWAARLLALSNLSLPTAAQSLDMDST